MLCEPYWQHVPIQIYFLPVYVHQDPLAEHLLRIPGCIILTEP